jgi:hypothetical protein
MQALPAWSDCGRYGRGSIRPDSQDPRKRPRSRGGTPRAARAASESLCELGQPAGREDRDPEARLFPDLDEAALRTAGRTTLPVPP